MRNSFKSGEIILVGFPFTDLSAQKVRPALVLRDQDDQDLLLAPISTTVNITRKDHTIESEDYEGRPLPVESCVRYRKLFTLNQKLVLKRVTRLKAKTVQVLRQKLSDFISGKG